MMNELFAPELPLIARFNRTEFWKRHSPIAQHDEEAVALRKLLRGELSAVEAYEEVIDHIVRAHNSNDETVRVQEALRSILKDHEDAVFFVKEMLRNEGVEPDEGSGVWGSVVQAVVASASLIGDDGALWALVKGEEHGLELYEDAIENGAIIHNRRHILTRSIPKQRAHLDRLSILMTV